MRKFFLKFILMILILFGLMFLGKYLVVNNWVSEGVAVLGSFLILGFIATQLFSNEILSEQKCCANCEHWSFLNNDCSKQFIWIYKDEKMMMHLNDCKTSQNFYCAGFCERT